MYTPAQPSAIICYSFLSSDPFHYFLQSLTRTGWQTPHLGFSHSVCVCGIKQWYEFQCLVHFSPASIDHHSHLLLHSFLFFLYVFISLSLGFHSAKYLLGTPETSLSGLSTLNALSALTSKPAAFPPIGVAPSPLVACSKIALNNLHDRNGFH